MKTALITGITGQDGAYLAQFLLQKGYMVYGAYRRASTANFWRIESLGINNHPNLKLVEYDLTDLSSCIRLVSSCKPDEVYNLAAQSFVGASFNQPVLTTQVNTTGPLNLLEAIRCTDTNIRFYQASTSEMFGKVQEVPQRETTPFYPRSPYGVAKLYGHWITINYRESYGIHASSGILFNHESPLRGIEFVTKKITDAVARIAIGHNHVLKLGNIDAGRDWGFAGDYVEGMWAMLQQPEPGEYILATGREITVRDFVKMAFKSANIDVEFFGEGANEYAVNTKTGTRVMEIDPQFYRSAEVNMLRGDNTRARTQLGWEPKVSVEQMCDMMVKFDITRLLKNT